VTMNSDLDSKSPYEEELSERGTKRSLVSPSISPENRPPRKIAREKLETPSISEPIGTELSDENVSLKRQLSDSSQCESECPAEKVQIYEPSSPESKSSESLNDSEISDQSVSPQPSIKAVQTVIDPFSVFSKMTSENNDLMKTSMEMFKQMFGNTVKN